MFRIPNLELQLQNKLPPTYASVGTMQEKFAHIRAQKNLGGEIDLPPNIEGLGCHKFMGALTSVIRF